MNVCLKEIVKWVAAGSLPGNLLPLYTEESHANLYSFI